MQLDMNAMMQISASGLKAQTTRMRTIAENIANAGTTGLTPGATPYQRQIPVFAQELDRAMGMKMVVAGKPVRDTSDYPVRFDPSHPAADEQGYVKLPNVKPIMETVDMKEAQRSYEANLSVIDSTRSMLKSTIDLLRA